MRKLVIATLALLLASSSLAAPLSKPEARIASWIETHSEEAVSFLGRSIDISSATQNLAGVRAAGELYATEFRRIGFETRWVEMPPEMKRAGHFIAERKGRRGKRILLIGHLDTVLEGERFRREGAVGYGSGSNDMKGGNMVILYALKALEASGALRDRTVTVVFTGDEEDPGNPKEVARKPLVDAARQTDIALAFETAVDNTAVVARRGVSTWVLDVTGQTGHSSGIFASDLGTGAIYEASRIIDGFYERMHGQKYLTFNTSVIVGGTEAKYDEAAKRGDAWGKTNVVPGTAIAEGDLRFLSVEQREGAKKEMQSIAAQHYPKTSASLVFRDEYPPMAPTEGNYHLLRVLDAVSRDLGNGEVTAFDPGSRGAGDISFVAELTDCLDGLGAMGENAHAPGETVDLASLPMLTKRTALMIYRLTR